MGRSKRGALPPPEDAAVAVAAFSASAAAASAFSAGDAAPAPAPDPAAPRCCARRANAAAPGPSPPSMSARARAARGGAPWLRAVRANPSELLAQPLLLAAVVLAAGFAATGIAASSAAAAERRSLQAIADGSAATLEFSLLFALAPVQELRDTLENDSALAVHSAALHYFARLAPGLVASHKAIASLQLWPYGRLAAVVPASGGSAVNGALLDLSAQLGVADLLDGAASPATRAAAVLALSAQDLVLLGPLPDVFACPGGGSSCARPPALVAHLPVFVPATSAADVWADSAWPAGSGGGSTVGPFTAATNCSGLTSADSGGASLCATNALGDGQRFWGFVSAVISWPHLLELARINELSDESAQSWTVNRLPDVFAGGTRGATSLVTAAFSAAGNNGASLPSVPFATGVVSAVEVASARFALSLQLPGGFVPEWVPAAAVCVATVGLLAAGALFTFLLERRLRYNLLVSMLPARVVRHMGSLSGAACAEPGASGRGVGGGDGGSSYDGGSSAAAPPPANSSAARTGGKVGAVGSGAGGVVSAAVRAGAAAAPTSAAGSFAERFEHVTVLFTDIVRFTDLVATITPAETMAMLNDLFFEFDDLIARAGVTKVETIGDAFMAVDGTDAPLRGPVAQALQMAAVALDMVDVAARHELPIGGQMRIRAGLHCGPVVAGVVGKTLPHWSLFGDTVNTAARMESNSIPGRVHVSTDFARLIHLAEEAARAAAAAAVAAGRAPPPPFPFVLQSRGSIAIKGKGVMVTHFVLRRGDALLPGEVEGTVASSPSESSATFYVNAGVGGSAGGGGGFGGGGGGAKMIGAGGGSALSMRSAGDVDGSVRSIGGASVRSDGGGEAEEGEEGKG